jgi:hypothetical protein
MSTWQRDRRSSYTSVTWRTRLRSPDITADVSQHTRHTTRLLLHVAQRKPPIHKQTLSKLPYRIFPLAKSTVMFNNTATALTHIAHAPVRLLASIPRPHFSYVPAAHSKLKADSIAMVFFCIARQIWMYVEGWRDSRRRKKRAWEAKAEDKQRS